MRCASLMSEIDPPSLLNFGDSFSGLGPRRRAKYRVFLYIQQGMACHYCKCKMIIDRILPNQSQPDNLATFEHLFDDWTDTRGKSNDLENVVLACRKCNNARNARRQRAAIAYYKSKFNTIGDWEVFSKKAKPKDFIAAFGVFAENA